ncbi:MAG: hypothetical protein V1738_01405 [Patescibacteria group bacterium]
MIKELGMLFGEIDTFPDDMIIEPDLDVAPFNHVVDVLNDLQLRRLFSVYVKRVKRLDDLHRLVRGPMLVRGVIPGPIRAMMMELQDEMDLLRCMFFYALAKKFDLFDRPYINVHKGWKVSWSNQAQTVPTSSNLKPLVPVKPGDDDDDEQKPNN